MTSVTSLSDSSFVFTELPFYGGIIPGFTSHTFHSKNNTYLHNAVTSPVVCSSAEASIESETFSHISGTAITSTSTLTVSSCTFTECHNDAIESNGGAIFCSGASVELVIKDTEFSQCSCQMHGGAVYATTKKFTIQDSKVTSCWSRCTLNPLTIVTSGGMMLSASGTGSVLSSVLFYNCTSDIGGACCLWGSVALSKCLFQRCTATRLASGIFISMRSR